MASAISTWTFSRSGVQTAARNLLSSSSALEAVCNGIETVELDPLITSVGYGGLPNADGILQLDAAIMTNKGEAGSVMAVEGLTSAITLARLVMQHSKHTMLASEGAVRFARECGLTVRTDPSCLLTEHAKKRYEQFRTGLVTPEKHSDSVNGMSHTDTVGMITRDSSGNIAVGCATSGMEFKAAGRVGDSPIIGAGLYADIAGAAVVSGDGDQMLRFCIAFLVVERMRAGDSANEACMYAMRRVATGCETCQAAVVAMNAEGIIGTACTTKGFKAVYWAEWMEVGKVKIIEAPGVGEGDWSHTCV